MKNKNFIVQHFGLQPTTKKKSVNLFYSFFRSLKKKRTKNKTTKEKTIANMEISISLWLPSIYLSIHGKQPQRKIKKRIKIEN